MRKLFGLYEEDWRKYDSHHNCIYHKNSNTGYESTTVFDYDEKDLLVHKYDTILDIYYIYNENGILTYSKEYDSKKQLKGESWYNDKGLEIKSAGTDFEVITEYDNNGNWLYNSVHYSFSDSEYWGIIDYWENGKKKSELTYSTYESHWNY